MLWLQGHHLRARELSARAAWVRRGRAAQAGVPQLKFVVLLWGQPDDEARALLAAAHATAPALLTWPELLELGGKAAAAGAWRAPPPPSPDQLATLVYTSGTTGAFVRPCSCGGWGRRRMQRAGRSRGRRSGATGVRVLGMGSGAAGAGGGRSSSMQRVACGLGASPACGLGLGLACGRPVGLA